MMVQRPTGSTAALSPGRVCRVAEACSADLKSAVSQVCNLRIVGKIGRLGSDRCPADYKSAIRQIENLRYGKHTDPKGCQPVVERSNTTGITRLVPFRVNLL